MSEEANNIEWGNRREVKLLRTEVERLKSELEAKCAEIQSIRDMEDLGDQDEPGDSIAELTARVQELEQQVAELKAELHQKDVESEGIEDADSVIEDAYTPVGTPKFEKFFQSAQKILKTCRITILMSLVTNIGLKFVFVSLL